VDVLAVTDTVASVLAAGAEGQEAEGLTAWTSGLPTRGSPLATSHLFKEEGSCSENPGI